MSSAKGIFLANKDLAAWWNSIAHDARFDHVVIFAKARFCETQPKTEEIKGVEAFAEIIQTLAENTETSMELPSPGLYHQIDKLPPKPEPK